MSDAKMLTHDEDGMVYACPHCDVVGGSYRRRGSNTHADDPEKPYYCKQCQTAFREPVERERKRTGPTPLGADLTPEDIGL